MSLIRWSKRRALPRKKVVVPETKKPIRKEPAVVAAMIGGICAVTVGGMGLIGVHVTAKNSVKPQPESPSCVVIVKEYQSAVKDNPAVLDALVQGGSSASVLSSDPNAKRCNITADVLAKLASK